jgi:hypothetical protein
MKTPAATWAVRKARRTQSITDVTVRTLGFTTLLAMRRTTPKIVKIPRDIPMSSKTNKRLGLLSREADVPRKRAPKRWASRMRTSP